jgi:hypothetical protein
MLRLFPGCLVVLALPALAGAEEVSMTFALPPEFADLSVTWSAAPLDLPADADMLAALILQPKATAGPWTVALKPGEYLISAFSSAEVFEQQVRVPPADGAGVVLVPPLELAVAVPYRCAEAQCSFVDQATGLAFDLPQGWAAEQPYHADLGAGVQAPEVSAVFFQDVDGDDAAVWFLNPPDWTEDDNGPCQPVDLGVMCSFALTPAATAALQVIAPSLRPGPAR